MVFGNLGDDCGTGVAFTRDPSTGENVFYGEYLINAQGEDVVAGIRTPQPIADAREADARRSTEQLLGDPARRSRRTTATCRTSSSRSSAASSVMLQTRTGKRTGFAAVRIAVDMVEEKLITQDEAVLRVDPDSLNQLLRPIFDPAAKRAAMGAGRFLAKGLNAGPGAATGRIVFTAQDASSGPQRGEKVILVRNETTPEDIHGMNAAEGILTARGGMTSPRGARRAPDGQGLRRRLRGDLDIDDEGRAR